jgi:hypothetical protein
VRKLFGRLPWWGKLLVILAILVCAFVLFIKFWWVIIGGFLLLVFVWALANAVGRKRYRSDINININQSSSEPRPRSWVQKGLGTNYYVPKVNKKGVDFITGRKKK